MSLLFTPVKVGAVELPNRLVVPPMCQYSAHDGTMNEWHEIHLAQMGYSGAGWIVVEATAVEPRGRITPSCVGLYSDDNEAAMKNVLTTARRWAGPAKFGIQLAHAGRKASARRPWEGGLPLTAREGAWQTVSASALPFADNWHVPQSLSTTEIDEMVGAWVQAARRAVRVGFDIVEIHCAHGYLFHEFLSPIANKREDEYGGSLSNRMRFPLAVIRAVRDALPAHIPLGMRVSATDWIADGWDIAQTIEFVKAARGIGIEFVCASSGGIVGGITVPIASGYQVALASDIKRATGLPTRAVGLINGAQQAENILQVGDADFIAVGRGMLDDPRWGWHAADALGASAFGPPQYALSRTPGWRKYRDLA